MPYFGGSKNLVVESLGELHMAHTILMSRPFSKALD
jgi:hypothetical protein